MKVAKVGINDSGWGNYNTMSSVQKRTYDMWKHMLHRCYNPKCSDYKTYGAKGVTVCDDWKYLSRFDKSIRTLANYDKWVQNKERYELDKDVVGRNSGCLEYSPSTCIFIKKSDNVKERMNRCGAAILDPSVSAKIHTKHNYESGVETKLDKYGDPCYCVNPSGVCIYARSCTELVRKIYEHDGVKGSHGTIRDACYERIDIKRGRKSPSPHVKTTGVYKGYGFWLQGQGPYPIERV